MNTNLRHSAQETGARPGFRLCFASPSAGGSRSFSEFLVGAIVVSVKKESWFWQQKGRAERECGAKKLAAKLGRMLETGGQRAALTTIAVCTPCSDWAELRVDCKIEGFAVNKRQFFSMEEPARAGRELAYAFGGISARRR